MVTLNIKRLLLEKDDQTEYACMCQPQIRCILDVLVYVKILYFSVIVVTNQLSSLSFTLCIIV